MEPRYIYRIGYIDRKVVTYPEKEYYMLCKCGGEMEVSIVESVPVLKCQSCGRGELIPQAKPQEVFDYRARVSLATKVKAKKSSS